MFTSFASDGQLTHYELKRLKYSEYSDRAMSVIMESVDLILQVVFTVVLFYQGGAIAALPLEWVWVQATTGQTCSGATVKDPRYVDLGIAAALCIAANIVWRAILAAVPVLTRDPSQTIQGSEWFVLFYGFWAALVDPWNGSIILLSVLGPPKGVDAYTSLKKEILVDASLLITESLPMFAIHVSYAVIAARVSAVSISWFISVTVSSLHLLSQLIEIFSLMRQLREAKSDKMAVMATV
jgi:hypothetical protein